MEQLELPIPDDYEPSVGELDNFVYLVCRYTVSWPVRAVDVQICTKMAGGIEAIRGNAGLSNLLQVTSEYLWDHICGEPEDTSAEMFYEHMRPILDNWYEKTSAEERSQID